mgnify:FL=1
MKKKTKIEMVQGTLRAGFCLFMLSSACALPAQTAETAANDSVTAAPVAKKANADKYVMREISGTVLDAATKEPMPGVRVQALDNRLYTAMTDENGKYTLRAPEFVTALYISCPDYNPVQLPVKAATGQDAQLYSNKIAPVPFYQDGTALVSNPTATIENSSAISVESEVENTLNSTLRVVSRGGLPAQGAAMFINGINSLNSIAQPLVVVDGVIWDMQYDRSTLHDGYYNNLFNLLDVEDIEQVKVLNNGAALYGAKASNGVIEITTKRGKSMATRINVRVYGGYELNPSKLSMMNADQYRSYLTEYIGTTSYIQQNPYAVNNIKFLNEDPNYAYYRLFHNNTDWQKDLYQNSFTQNYRINVDGGDDVAMYRLSLGYTKADATAKENDFDRLNIRFNTDILLFNNFTTKFDISFVRTSANVRDNGWASSYDDRNISSPNVLGLIQAPFISPYQYFMDPETMTLKQSMDVYAGKDNVTSDATNPFNFASEFGDQALANPYWILLNGQGDNKNFMEQTQFNINVNPQYTIGKYWTISDRFSYMINRNNEKYYMPRNGTPDKFVDGLGSINSVLASQFGKETTLYNDFRIDWNQNFGAHSVHAFGGFRLASYTFTDSYARGYNNSNDKMPNMSMTLNPKTYGGTTDKWMNLAYYLNAEYNYKNRYFIQALATMESSSRFGRDAEEGIKLAGVRWGFFPSVQAAWLISSESWFNVKPINYLKLMAGYEETGNDNIDYYASRTYFSNVEFFGEATALLLSNIQNPTIQWETNRRVNVGLEGALLNNRLMFGVNFYRSKISNLLTQQAVSDITGLPFMWSNGGAMKNIGVNANLSAVLVNKKDWRWEVSGSVGHYKNEITQLPGSNTIEYYRLDDKGQKLGDPYKTVNGYTSSIYGTDNVLTAVGEAAGVFYGYQTQGVFASAEEAQEAGLRYPTGLTNDPYREFKAGDVHFVDQNGDGWIDESDMVKIGDPNPDIYGNFATRLSWKDLTLDVMFKYSLGNDIFNYQRSQLEGGNTSWNQTTALVNRWRYDGQVTDVPRAVSSTSSDWVNNERFSDRWIEDGSYLKLKKIRLTYRIPVNVSWLQSLSVWGEANNVFTVTKYLGLDPEVSCSNSVLSQGIDAGYLPQSCNFNLGVTINL